MQEESILQLRKHHEEVCATYQKNQLRILKQAGETELALGRVEEERARLSLENAELKFKLAHPWKNLFFKLFKIEWKPVIEAIPPPIPAVIDPPKVDDVEHTHGA